MKTFKYFLQAFPVMCLCLSNHAFAQQQSSFTNYMYNVQTYNPAYVGSRQAISVVGLYRLQWVGYDGAPKTQTISVSAPIAKQKLGLGLSFENDKIGPMNSTSAYADFAYHLPLTEKSKLSFGTKIGVNLLSTSLSSVKLDDPNDVSFNSNMQNKAIPNVGFGMYYYSPKFYAGISTPQILTKTVSGEYQGQSMNLYQQKVHFYMIAGTVFNLTEALDLKPTMLTKVVAGAPVQVDLTTTLIYKQLLYAGIMVRTGESVGGLFGFMFSNTLLFGYSYDWTILNKTNSYHYGSHELVLRYDFALKKNRNNKNLFLGYF
ncbi:PorP/SprF family type IX secretion system membrane protein [Cytophaga aurantiaca]|uniref:PorP/SprF family type IX secretion system membrane protein n=1 Tax=Cytophaga aurantiaca TaxID=29530 RepID=UPI000526738A|nr:type IX secretion system membrane protein PorP/SprF [Cytophaga aurantiaca]